ncbi:MAG: stage 0 sporulation family protein [Clostridia bacterium]|nr:stage 0 sporulation family protein [Clostridia bacterium]
MENKEIIEKEASLPETVEVVGIKFREGGKTYYFSPEGLTVNKDDHVIVETARGREFGICALSNRQVKRGEIVSPLKPVVRAATEEDEKKHEQNKAMEERAKQIFLEKVQKNGLVMQLVDVEYTFDNSKLIFYFTADGRVDFRELVKDLASVFRTRIELRQIGVRDEAKLIGGLGVCGRPFCCKEFLPDFAQVSIKMAKEQNLSLSSAKISGSCGRLMCCLRFEHEVYETEYATFPKVDSIVETPAGKGVITESNFLTGKIKVKLNGDQNAPVKVFTKKDVKVVGMVKRRDDNSEDLKKLEE